MLWVLRAVSVTDPQVDVAAGVDAGIALDRSRGDDLGRGTDDLAHGAHDVQAVAAQVHQRAAGQFKLPAGIVVARSGHPHVDLDVAQFAKVPERDQFQQSAGHRVIAVVERLHHRHTRGLCGRGHFARLVGVAGVRLFGQHRLAGPHRGDVPRPVQ